jgi:hypothetical protein
MASDRSKKKTKIKITNTVAAITMTSAVVEATQPRVVIARTMKLSEILCQAIMINNIM